MNAAHGYKPTSKLNSRDEPCKTSVFRYVLNMYKFILSVVGCARPARPTLSTKFAHSHCWKRSTLRVSVKRQKGCACKRNERSDPSVRTIQGARDKA